MSTRRRFLKNTLLLPGLTVFSHAATANSKSSSRIHDADIQQISKNNETSIWVTPYDFGAKGDGVTDDTLALMKMFSAGSNLFDMKSGRYLIRIPEKSSLHIFKSLKHLRITGNSAVIYDTRHYTADSITAIFMFDACADCKITGVSYEGIPLASPSDPKHGVGYLGATFVNLKNGCSNIEVNSILKHCRYGVRSGDYEDSAQGYNSGIKTVLQTYRCGYPVAHYLADNVIVDVNAVESHRSVYLAGVHHGTVNAKFKDQHIAPIQVILSDSKTGKGTSRGCADLKINAQDLGSTKFTENSWAAGISLSRVDPGTIFENIDFNILIIGTDTIATTLGAFIINSIAKIYQPSYVHNWESTISLKNIKITGVVNRSSQTLPTHGVGELYIRADDGPMHAATVTSLNFDRLEIINGSGRNPQPLSCVTRNVTDRVSLKYCNFGNYALNFVGRTKASFDFVDCAPISHI